MPDILHNFVFELPVIRATEWRRKREHTVTAGTERRTHAVALSRSSKKARVCILTYCPSFLWTSYSLHSPPGQPLYSS